MTEYTKIEAISVLKICADGTQRGVVVKEIVEKKMSHCPNRKFGVCSKSTIKILKIY